MNRIAICATLLFLLATPLRAERPVAAGLGVSNTGTISAGDLKPTPEMWFYEQSLRQYNDPKAAVRAKADFRADQRQRRLESMKWFGFSNFRPHASSDPFHNDYSPGWVASPACYPSRWSGVNQP
jgi:hypothetical protein